MACGRRGLLEKSTTEVPRRPAAAATAAAVAARSKDAWRRSRGSSVAARGSRGLPETPQRKSRCGQRKTQRNATIRKTNHKKTQTNPYLQIGGGEAARLPDVYPRQQILPVDVSIDSARACSTYVEEAGSEVASSRSLQGERLPDKHDKEKTTSNEERTRREQGTPKVPRGRESHAKERRKKMQGGRAKKKKQRKHAQSN